MNHPFIRTALLGVIGTMFLGACSDDDRRSSEPTFDFRSESASAFARVDRMGQPAVATALLSNTPATGMPSRQDSNLGDPANDARDFLPAMVATLRRIHVELDPQLRSLGLVTCTTTTVDGPGYLDQCAAQAAGAIAPDTISLNLDAPDGWPNGRRYDDAVVDRLLAVALLDLRAATGQTIDTLANLPLNPPGNDASAGNPSPTTFPFLRIPVAGP